MINSFNLEPYWLNAMKSDRKHIGAVPTIPTLARYDQEMFDFHNKIEALEEQWGREKQELAKVFESFVLFNKTITSITSNYIWKIRRVKQE